MAAKGLFSYWMLPVISGLVWLGMLLGLLLHWIVDTHRRRYPSMEPEQTIAFISDVGAQRLKPLFIAGAVVVTVFLDLSFAAERWLRHRGRLVPNISVGEKILFALTVVFALVGTVGLILLSIFDTARHPTLHDVFLLLFIAGYLISAIFICWEYQRLGSKNRRHRILRASFWIKLSFILVELALAVAFGILSYTNRSDKAAILEWVVSFIFTFYILSFFLDLLPAVRHKLPGDRFPKPTDPRQMEEANGAANGHNLDANPPTHF